MNFLEAHRGAAIITNFAGVPFTAATPGTAVEMTLQAVHEGRGVDVHLLNAYSVALTQKDRYFAQCTKEATFNFSDGKPVSLLSRLFGYKLHQVRGPAFFETVLDEGKRYGTRHFLLGSSPETLSRLKMNLEQKFPGVEIVGSMSPAFRKLSETELAEQDQSIGLCNPDVVWVGLGTPKQDFEAGRLARAGFNAIAVGAAFDFSAGTIPIAPRWMRKIGLEWFHRLLSEPARLWKRYLWGNTVFLSTVAKSAFSR